MWKTLIASILLTCLAACQSEEKGQAAWQEPGVSYELASFRKEHFGQVKYNLFFSIPEQRKEPVTGTVNISLELKKPQPLVIDFRAEADQVSAVTLNGMDVPYEVKSEHIWIDKAATVAGENQVAISFVSADQSLNRRDDFLYTLLVPDRARTIFPCFDQPNLKALYRLTLEVPAAWQAVSNGAIETVDTTTVAGRKRISFRQTEPLSSYLFSFVAGEMSRLPYERDGREISIYHRETDPKRVAQCPDIANEVFDALAWLEEYTGIPYPFAKYDLIIVPGFQYGGMEHTGATLYNVGRMFLDEQPTLNARLSRSSLIAHETAHMWFGDYVTMDWFDDVWTKEVFANYFASQMVEPLYPEVNHRFNFIRGYLPSSYAEDRTAGSNPIKQELDNLRNAGLVYGNIIYNKSPIVMEMLVEMLGKEAFQKGIREYLTTYAYGNATWDGLIRILDSYTDEDLAAWSEVWVHEKGMPALNAEVKGNELVVTQQDDWGRGIYWPQLVTYKVIASDGTEEDVQVAMSGKGAESRATLQKVSGDDAVVIPNIDGRAYGFFRIADDEKSLQAITELLNRTEDEVLRGSLLIALNENLRHNGMTAAAFRQILLSHIPQEKNSLLYSMSLGYLGGCQSMAPADEAKVESFLWNIATTHTDPIYRLQAFRQYRSVATTPEAIQRLYQIWKQKKAPAGCVLSEGDYSSLSYKLALYLPEQYESIIAEQLKRISNPDRRKAYEFISPSVSPKKEVRDSVFQSLLIAENRRIEPWASSALGNLNHRLHEESAIAYIRPALEVLQEVQRTGDIFFPARWLGALLGGHRSEAARKEVEAFFEAHPDYPDKLSNKIRQQSHHLFVPVK